MLLVITGCQGRPPVSVSVPAPAAPVELEPRETRFDTSPGIIKVEIEVENDIAQQAQERGAEVLVHYIFPRNFGNEAIAQRREIIIDDCEQFDIEFVEVFAPDPHGEAGPAGMRQFIEEDIPRQIQAQGRNVAFYGADCAMRETLFRDSQELGVLVLQSVCSLCDYLINQPPG